jgi:uncharacterized protein YggE
MDNFSSRKLQAIAIISAIAASVVAGGFFALGNPLVPQVYSLNSAALASSPSIKVTGDATASLVPDQATVIVNLQTQPGDLTEILAIQDGKIADIRQAVQGAVDDATVTIGSRSIYPYYSGNGVPVNDEVTFNIYATTAIQTDINQLADLVNALAKAGFGFESVYIDPYYQAQILREAGIPPVQDSEEPAAIENPITIGVTLSVEPAVLTEAIEKYEEKYRTLQGVLEELNIPENQIQNNSFQIFPVYYGNSQTSSYQANTQVIVRTNPDRIDDVSAAIREVDNTFVENVMISVSDQAIDDARKDLTDKAIANARERASEMVDDLGFEVAGIKSIEAATGSSISPYGGEYMYRGVKIFQPAYYQAISGDIAISIAVEFELTAAASGE